MQNLNDGEKQRVGKLIEECYMSLTDKIKNLEKIGQTVEEKMQSFQPKLLTHLQKKCKNQYDWIEKNRKYIRENGTIAQNAPEDIEDNLKALETCSLANDFGIGSFFKKVETQNYNAQKDNESCLTNCVTDLSSKSDDQMKSCFMPCFTSYFNNAEQSIQGVINEVTQTEKRF